MVDFLLHPALWSSAAFCAIPPWNPWWITSEWRLKWHTFSCHHVIGVYGYIYPICRELSWHVNIVASTQSVHCMGHLFTAQRGFLLRSRISPAAENHSVQCISVLYMAQWGMGYVYMEQYSVQHRRKGVSFFNKHNFGEPSCSPKNKMLNKKAASNSLRKGLS